MFNKITSSPDLKTYTSTIRIPTKQPTLGITQRILTKILSNRFSDAAQQSTLYHNEPLRRINSLCYEYYLLKQIIKGNRIIDKQNKLLTSSEISKEFQAILQKVIQLKEYRQYDKKYFEEIELGIMGLGKDEKFDWGLVSGNNVYMGRIKQSLFNVSSFIQRLKTKLSHQQKKANLLLRKQKEHFQSQTAKNIMTLQQKNSMIQEAYAKLQRSQQKIIQMQQTNELLLLNHEAQKKTLLIQVNQLSQKLNQTTLQINKYISQNQTLASELSTSKVLNQQLENKIQELQRSEKNYLKQRKDYQQKLSSKNQTINTLISEIESANEMIKESQTSERYNQDLIEQLRNNNDELELKCQNLSLAIHQLKRKNYMASQNLQIDELKSKNNQLQLKCQELNNQLNDNFIHYQTQTSNISQLMEEQQELKDNLAIQQNQKINLLNRIDQMKVQLQRYRILNNSLQERQTQLDFENDKLNRELNNLNFQFINLAEKYQTLKTQYEHFTPKIEAECMDECLNTILSLYDLDKIQKKVIEDQQIIKKCQQDIEVLNTRLLHLQQNNEEMSSKCAEFQKKYSNLSRDIDFAKIQRKDLFFQGKMLEQDFQGRGYLQAAIQKAQHRRIRKTTLLYRLDDLNKVNVHKYIDNIPNIVLLVRTEADWVVGGYSQGPFYPRMVSNKNGILISITGKRVYELKVQNKRAIAYDDFFVIFGNSQIRIKTQQYKLFSNFGISSCYYENRDEKVEVITGQRGAREVLIKGFEFFQVQFY